MRVLLLVALAAVAASAVYARALTPTDTTAEAVSGGSERCYGFSEWTRYCLIVEDLTRMVVDLPRTFGYLEDAAIIAGYKILDILVTPEYLGEAIQAFIAVQLDAVFWVPKAIWGVVEWFINGSHDLVRFLERLTKQHIIVQLKILFVEPVYYIRKLLHGTWSGIKAGLEKSGGSALVAWVEALEAKFNTYVLKPIVHFLDFMGGHLRCTTLLPESLCQKIYAKLAFIDNLYMHMWTDFWDMVHGPGWGILDYLRMLIRPIINFLDKIPQRLRDFCDRRPACMHFVETIEKIDHFARTEVDKGKRVVEWVVLWIKKHFFEDVKMIAPSLSDRDL